MCSLRSGAFLCALMSILDNLDDGSELASILQRFYPLLIERAFEDAALAGVEASYHVDLAEVQAVLDTLGKRIKDITETTRSDIQRLVGLQSSQGWSMTDLANEISQLGDIASTSRALLISRTETGTAYNLGSVAAYHAGGITHVEVLDGGGSDSDDICNQLNGSIQTLAWAEANPLEHPNCVRAFAPVVE